MENLLKVYFGPYKKQVALIVILLIIQVTLQIFIINSIRPIITNGINDVDPHTIMNYGICMLLLIISYSLTTVYVSHLAARISAESVSKIRDDMFRKILSFKRPRDSGANMSGLMNRLVTDVNYIQEFITEALWQAITERKDGESIMFETLPKYVAPSADAQKVVADFEAMKEVIAGIRTIRAQKQMSPKVAVELQCVGANPVEALNAVVTKLANTSSINIVKEKSGICASFLVGTVEFAIPLADSINVEEELKKLEADLKYNEGFLQSVLKKLSNEKFVNGAPAAVVENERKKQADAESKIETIKQAIAALKA